MPSNTALGNHTKDLSNRTPAASPESKERCWALLLERSSRQSSRISPCTDSAPGERRSHSRICVPQWIVQGHFRGLVRRPSPRLWIHLAWIAVLEVVSVLIVIYVEFVVESWKEAEGRGANNVRVSYGTREDLGRSGRSCGVQNASECLRICILVEGPFDLA